MNSLFLYNNADLNSPIPGGVQKCSKEFLKVLTNIDPDMLFFSVEFNKKISFRILKKLNLDNYRFYNISESKHTLTHYLIENKITHVFINKAELIRYTGLIKRINSNIKTIILSHGNETGDLLDDLARPFPYFRGIRHFFGKIKLGLSLYTEAYYRKRYIDLVCAMSEEEVMVEKWIGAKKTFFFPRIITPSAYDKQNQFGNILGYVGTLSHSPNYTALTAVCSAVQEQKLDIELHIVGSPINIGEKIAKKYAFVKYLGPLKESDLEAEIREWSIFINPIFSYARGASMKLAFAIEKKIPFITTIAGRRGYQWSDSRLCETINDVSIFVAQIKKLTTIEKEYEELIKETDFIFQNSATVNSVSNDLQNQIKILG